MNQYQDLQIELKNTIDEVKKAAKNSIECIKLKRRANELHLELIRIEKMINNFK